MMSKQLLRNLLGFLMVAGIFVALWPLGQSVYANWNQQQLRAQWENQKQEFSAKKQKTNSSSLASPNGKVAGAKNSPPKPEWPQTRLLIPDADVDVVVLDGWDDGTLQKAPGHWPNSALPGQKGNIAIAGHRNVYGSPFYKVDALQPGAPIELRTPDETFLYRVVEVKVAADSDMTVLQPSSDPQMPPLLTLVTCTIPRTSTRIIVSAALEETS